MKWLKWILLAGVVAGFGWWLWQRVFVTDEQRVQRLLAKMVKAVETGNLLQLEAGIAQDYTDDFGFDKSTIIGGNAVSCLSCVALSLDLRRHFSKDYFH